MNLRIAIVTTLLAGSLGIARGDQRPSESGLDVCDGSDFQVCLEGAGRLARGEGRAANPWGAYMLLSWLCENSLEAACKERVTLGMPKADEARTVFSNWAASCRAGQATDCFAVAMVRQRAKPEPLAEIAPVLERACDAGELRACSRLAYHLMDAGPLHDPKRGLALCRRLCGVRHFQCGAVAEWLASAEGGRDFAEARRIVDVECKTDHPLGCYHLGRVCDGLTGGPRDVEAAADAWSRGCQLGEAMSCNWLASLQVQGTFGKEAVPLARKAWNRSCDELHDDDGCVLRAEDDERHGRFDDAANVYERVCKAGMAKACNDLGACIDRHHCAVDNAKAAQAHKRACELAPKYCPRPAD